MSSPAIPKGSVVLVTGVNGYLASHVADQLLLAGYKVRGTAREQHKADWTKEYFSKKYGPDKFEVVVVPDMAAKGVFTEPMKGCAGVAHVASNLTFSPDPTKVIPEVISGVTNVLEAAAAHPDVKRFVYTSSSAACLIPKPGVKLDIDSSTWNEESKQIAHAPPPYTEERGFPVYAASKTEAEQAAWAFVKSNKPQFVLNCVLPNFILGEVLHEKQPASTAGMVKGMCSGNEQSTSLIRDMLPPQWLVDVKDVARLHVAGLIESDVQNERIFAFAETFTYNSMLEGMRKISPGNSKLPQPADRGEDVTTVANDRAIELLKRFGRPGFTPFQDSLAENLK